MSTPSWRPPVPGPPPNLSARELGDPSHPAPAGHAADPDEPTPHTGQPEVDEALERVAGLSSLPLDEHPERLARAHEALHAHLQGQPRHETRPTP